MVTLPVVGPVGVAVEREGALAPGVETVRAPSTGTTVVSGRRAVAVAVYVVFGVRPAKSATMVGDVTVMGEPPLVGVKVTV